MLNVRLNHQQGAFTLDVDFQAPPGITVLFGRSGSGKTTIVNAVTRSSSSTSSMSPRGTGGALVLRQRGCW